MFPSTITLTIDSVPKVLNRINQDNYGSEYLLADTTARYSLKIRHSEEPRKTPSDLVMLRHNVLLEVTTYGDLTHPDENRTVTTTIRTPKLRATANAINESTAFNAWLGTSSNIADLVNGMN